MLFNQKNPKMKSISDYEENIFHTNKNIIKKKNIIFTQN